MSDIPEVADGQEEVTSAVTHINGSPDVQSSGSGSSVKDKKLGQFTFDDFEHIKHVDKLQDTSGHSIGLRRSKRIPQVRSNKELHDLEEEAAAAAERSRRAKAALKAKARAKEREKLTKEKQKASAAASKKNTKEGVKKSSSIASAKNVSKTPELYEPPLTDSNWTPNMPLLSSDFKNHHSVISRMKNPNMKPIAYAGDVIKLMSFINKFHLFFDEELLNLSFQDFEIGLDLYPGAPKGIASGVYDIETQRTLFYQDFITIKDVVVAQDKMNLLFLTLLKLTFATSKSTEPQKKPQPQATLSQLKASKKVLANLVKQLRENAREWGYPKEWRHNDTTVEEFLKPKSSLFDKDDSSLPVDPKNPEILTPNIHTWHHHEPVAEDIDPLQVPDLDKKGILALNPLDRIICLRALVDWCGSQSPKIRNETYHLSHFKRDPTFGIQTQHAPRYLVEGKAVTFAQFKKLCSIVQSRYEIRSKKKHVKKQLQSGKREALSKKLILLKEIKATLNEVSKEEKDKTLISQYDKWCKLFDGELTDNPLGDPFEDEIYKLRQQEFFIGRVPHIGDFFLPRLHTYPTSPVSSTYTDLRNLQELFEGYANGVLDVFTLFENHGQAMSTQFKLLYRDTPSLVRDTAQGKTREDKNYWYEMCHDCKTLQEFIQFLDYKIAPGEPAQEHATIQENVAAEEPDQQITDASHAELVKESKNGQSEDKLSENEKLVEINGKKLGDTNSNAAINKHPLPKEARFNVARNKLRCLKDFLSGMLPVLSAFERLREQYGDMKPGKRLLRRSQRRSINYDTGAASDAEDFDEEYVDDEDDKDDRDLDDHSDENEEPEPDLKRARIERREARTSRQNARRS